MDKILFVILTIIVINLSNVKSQNFEYTLNIIEKNNPELNYLKKKLDADGVGFKTDILPNNPAAELDYFLTNPNNFEFRLSQSLDFPSSYFYKSEISDIQIKKAETEFQLARKVLLKKVRTVLIELIKLNKSRQIFEKRLSNAENLDNYTKRRMEAGDINIIEKNKISFEKLNTELQLKILIAEITAKNKELFIMNGNKEISFNDTLYPNIPLMINKNNLNSQILTSNLYYTANAFDTLISQKQISLSKSLNLPGIQFGYRIDLFDNKTEHGLIFGISLPLWQNRNKLKYAELQNEATNIKLANINNELTGILLGLLNEYTSYQSGLADYKDGLQGINNPELLNKALNAGEISVIEYIIELNIYFESQTTQNNLEFEINIISNTINSYF